MRLGKNKEDLLYTKKNQETTIRELNQNCKILKDSLMLSEQNIHKITREKDELDKHWTQKLNIAVKENEKLQKMQDGLRLKSKEVATEQR